MVTIGPLVLLELAQTLIEALHLLASVDVLYPAGFFVELDASDAVKSVLVQPSAPPDAHAVQNESRFDVHLRANGTFSFNLK